MRPTFYELFAGGGMARAGLGEDWSCLFANDLDPRKVETYRANWGGAEIKHGDIYDLSADDLPGAPDLAWGSFPCQDLSLAGNGAGLSGTRSEAFWGFHRVINLLKRDERAPKLLVLENVVGALTSNDGNDFGELSRALRTLGYVFGGLVMDAARFLPQSRPRLFIVGVLKDIGIPQGVISDDPVDLWTSKALIRAHAKLPAYLKADWRWWSLPASAAPNIRLADIVESSPSDVPWHSAEETKKLLGMMSEPNRRKVDMARLAGGRMVGAIYRRTRIDDQGRKVQRAEIRFDLAGCLRTPSGGSSRQFIMVVEGDSTRTRLISGRETARLMGLPDDYTLPENYNEDYHLTGDGLAVPVVRYLSETLLRPLLVDAPAMLAAE